jgi:hypothetical protein
LCSRRFWIAPNVARIIETLLIAWSILSIAALADTCVESETLYTALVALSAFVLRPRPEDVQLRSALRLPIAAF